MKRWTLLALDHLRAIDACHIEGGVLNAGVIGHELSDVIDGIGELFGQDLLLPSLLVFLWSRESRMRTTSDSLDNIPSLGSE